MASEFDNLATDYTIPGSRQPEYAWVNKYDHAFAPIQTKPDWKDHLITAISVPGLFLVIYFAIVNTK